MRIDAARVLLTGAAGGIGAQLALALAARGACLMLADRDTEALSRQLEDLTPQARVAPLAIQTDLTTAVGLEEIRRGLATHWQGELDVVIHNAGVLGFAPFEEMTMDALDRIVAVNVTVPLKLTRLVLPGMIARGTGMVVCVGSILGTLALPYFTAYSASKFAVRGFAEALRREVASSGVRVCYVGPRSVKTRLNTPAVEKMAAALGMRMDEPATVAAALVRAIERDRPEVNLGFPEALFARLNACLPRLVDRALVKQTEAMGAHARSLA